MMADAARFSTIKPAHYPTFARHGGSAQIWSGGRAQRFFAVREGVKAVAVIDSAARRAYTVACDVDVMVIVNGS